MISPRVAQAITLSASLHAAAVVLLLAWSLRLGKELPLAPLVIEFGENAEGERTTGPGSAIRFAIPRASSRGDSERAPPYADETRASEATPAPGPSVLSVPAAGSKTPTRPTAVRQPSGIPVPSSPATSGASASRRQVADISPGRSTSPLAPGSPVPHVDTQWNFGSEAATPSGAVVTGRPGRRAAELKAYFDELRRRLEAALQVPPGVGGELRALVGIHLTADGALNAPRLLESSGDAAFDRAVLTAIERTQMSPRPDGVSEDITIPFTSRPAQHTR